MNVVSPDRFVTKKFETLAVALTVFCKEGYKFVKRMTEFEKAGLRGV